MAQLSGAAAAAPYSHQHPGLGHGKSVKQSPLSPAGSPPSLQPPRLWQCPGRLTPPAGMWPGHQAMAGSLMPPSKVVSLPHRKGPLLPPRDRKTALNPTKHQHFKGHSHPGWSEMNSHFCMDASPKDMDRVGFFVIISLFVVLCLWVFFFNIHL